MSTRDGISPLLLSRFEQTVGELDGLWETADDRALAVTERHVHLLEVSQEAVNHQGVARDDLEAVLVFSQWDGASLARVVFDSLPYACLVFLGLVLPATVLGMDPTVASVVGFAFVAFGLRSRIALEAVQLRLVTPETGFIDIRMDPDNAREVEAMLRGDRPHLVADPQRDRGRAERPGDPVR
ncbi:hypothetical protein ACNS7O_14175 [Haloferacaceae archaeon DSL9]